MIVMPVVVGRSREMFTGKELDDEGTGLNFGKRYYDPLVGVWNAVDPQLQYWSPYAYSGNGLGVINGLDNDGSFFAAPLLESLSEDGLALL